MARGKQKKSERDDEGRFMSQDNDDGRRRQSRSSREDADYHRPLPSRSSRYEEEDEDEGSYWRSGRGRYEEDDEDHGPYAHSGGGRDFYEEDEGEDEGEAYPTWSRSGGRDRYQDKHEGHAFQARGSSHIGRDHGGWPGDRQRNLEAAQRGREQAHRGQGRGRRHDDDEGYAPRSQSSPHSSRSGSRRGHGGWFGDHREGHSQAARQRGRH